MCGEANIDVLILCVLWQGLLDFVLCDFWCSKYSLL